MTSLNENRQNTLYLRNKSVAHVIPFSKMEVQFELQLIWWESDFEIDHVVSKKTILKIAYTRWTDG